MKKKILIVFGTRPEAIKMVPIINELKNYTDVFESKVCVTAQHRELLDQVLYFFKVVPDFDLNLMQKNQTLHELTSRIILSVTQVLEDFKPDLILVHGDTTTAMASALAAYYKQIDIAHIEAGLRSFDLHSPWPEEGNRKIITQLAKYHFTPTQFTYDNLIRENINKNNIFIAGNTIIDVMNKILNEDEMFLSDIVTKQIFITLHRREKSHDTLNNILTALENISKIYTNVDINIFMHNSINLPSNHHIWINDNVHIMYSLDYEKYLNMLRKTYFILTDSGGIQEEASYLGIPVLLARDITDRQEVEGVNMKIIGTDKTTLEREIKTLLTDDRQYENLCKKSSIYGNGFSSKKILNFLYRVMEV